MKDQKGFAHILLIILILLVAVLAVVYFVLPKLGVNTGLPGLAPEPKVSVKEEYKNPFKKEAQYINPFDQYKSPLVNLKK